MWMLRWEEDDNKGTDVSSAFVYSIIDCVHFSVSFGITQMRSCVCYWKLGKGHRKVFPNSWFWSEIHELNMWGERKEKLGGCMLKQFPF
jgi:hypothetical protein